MAAIYRNLNPDGNSSSSYITVESPTGLSAVEDHSLLVNVKACGLSYLSSQTLVELFRRRPCPQYPAGWEVTGIVSEVGKNVSQFKPGDRIAGLLALDAQTSGCSKSCVLQEYDCTKLPDSVSYEAGAACVGDGLKAYTALYYNGHLCRDDTVLFTDVSPHWVNLAVQLAQNCKAKVLTAVTSGTEKTYLQGLNPPADHLIEVGENTNILWSSVIEETGGLGVDVIIDNGVRLFTNKEDSMAMGENTSKVVPSKHELISCLGVGGRWVTSHSSLQLDPPNCEQLFMRGSSVSFLFEHIWTLSSTKQGKFQHILENIMKKLADGSLKPNITKVVNLEDAKDTLQQMDLNTFGKIVINIP